jgi:ribose 1,5-bisphosphokinase
MGPSGAGKDSILEYARRKTGLAPGQPVIFTQRYITRPADPDGERHCPLSREEFRLRRAAGFFALCWESHGLSYGIGRELDKILASGAVAVVSGSRLYLPEARKRYSNLVPVLITARADILRSRLEKRGREDAADIEERLGAAAAREIRPVPGLITVDNSGSLATAQRHFLKILRRIAAGQKAAHQETTPER